MLIQCIAPLAHQTLETTTDAVAARPAAAVISSKARAGTLVRDPVRDPVMAKVLVRVKVLVRAKVSDRGRARATAEVRIMDQIRIRARIHIRGQIKIRGKIKDPPPAMGRVRITGDIRVGSSGRITDRSKDNFAGRIVDQIADQIVDQIAVRRRVHIPIVHMIGMVPVRSSECRRKLRLI